MKKLYNNKTLYDWIVWICIIAMIINVVIPFKGAFWTFVLMVFSIARYNNLADKEIERLVKECEKKDELQLECDKLFDCLKEIEKQTKDKETE